mmetsp:Transcript_53661/g.142239  ORF Transcript_53661/g.142239 Transcript_53661/m.142239 type:complete len:191 (-) Transcript_53661:219-791(-)
MTSPKTPNLLFFDHPMRNSSIIIFRLLSITIIQHTCLFVYSQSYRFIAEERFLEAFRVRSGDLFSQHALLAELEQTHQDLYHFILSKHFEELSPAVAGKGLVAACSRYGDIQRKRPAIYFGLKDLGTIYIQLKEMIHRLDTLYDGLQYRVVVVSDGEHVHDAGDVGVWSAGAVVSKYVRTPSYGLETKIR